MSRNQLDRRGRLLLALANAALVMGLTFSSVSTAASEHLRPGLHAAAGFMMGLSVTVHLMLLWRRRRNGPGNRGTDSGRTLPL